jgi:hypothetical protein
MGNIPTTFLTADGSFITGMGSSVALSGNFYGFNYAPTPAAADARALRADWAIVGQDIQDAMAEADAEPECRPKK